MTKSRLLPAGPRPDNLCPYKRVGLAGGGHFLVAWPTLEQQSRIFAVICKTLRIFHVVFVFLKRIQSLTWTGITGGTQLLLWETIYKADYAVWSLITSLISPSRLHAFFSLSWQKLPYLFTDGLVVFRLPVERQPY